MRLTLLLAVTLSVCAIAAPLKAARAIDSDETITYPDEKLYAEEYKRGASSADEAIAYPDEKLYAEEYKRSADTDESIAYPDEKLYAEEY